MSSRRLDVRRLRVLPFIDHSCIAAAQAFAADDVVTRAMKLYEKRHYDEAARMLRAESASIEQAKKGSANLALGMIYFKNAVLHRELYQAAVVTSQDYLKKLSAAQGEDRSRFVDLYLGEALVESGKSGAAAIYLKKFSQGNGVEPRYRAIAKVCLGLGYYQNNEASKATELWGGIDTSDPEVKAELAAAYSKAGLTDKNPSVIAEGILSEMKRSGKPLSMRMVKNFARHLRAGAGLTEKGLDLLNRSDLKAFSYREILGKSKVITFLRPFPAQRHGDPLWPGERGLPGEGRCRPEGQGRSRVLSRSGVCAVRLDRAVFEGRRRPSSPRRRCRSSTRTASGYGRAPTCTQRNRQTEAMGVWDELVRKQPEDPDLIAEILFACSRMKMECPRVLQKAAAMVEAGESKKLSLLNIAIGQVLSRQAGSCQGGLVPGGRTRQEQ